MGGKEIFPASTKFFPEGDWHQTAFVPKKECENLAVLARLLVEAYAQEYVWLGEIRLNSGTYFAFVR